MARIRIEDLPPIDTLTAEEMAALFGAGLRPRLGFESLEGREVPAALTAALSGGILTVTGTSQAEYISVFESGGKVQLRYSDPGVVSSNRLTHGGSYSGVNQVVVNAGAGDDVVNLNFATFNGVKVHPLSKPSVVDGGSGNDTVYGGTGNDVIYGGAGDDALYGNGGSDHLYGGADNDYLDGGGGGVLSNGTLQYTGNADNNDVLVKWSGNDLRVRVTNTPAASGLWLVDPTTTSVDYFNDPVSKLTFNGQGGNDAFDNETLIRAVANGGSGTNSFVGNAGDQIAGFQAVDLNNLPGGNAQGNTNTCGPNSAWRVINAYGGYATLQQVIDRVSNTSVVSHWNLGTTGATLVNAMNDLRRGMDHTFRRVTQSSLDSLLGQLASGKPVVAMIRVPGTEVYQIGGVVGGIIGQIPVIGGITRYEIPALHWIAVDGFDRAKQLIYYTDTDGGRYQMSFASFESVWKWNFGAVQNKLLQGLGVVSGTYIV